MRTLLLLAAMTSLAYADRAEEPMPSRRAPPPPVATPSEEIAKLGKAIAGTYKCKGVMMRGDGSSTPLVASIAIKLDLDNAWIHTSFAQDTSKLKYDDFRTYDPVAKQWTKIQLVNSGGHTISTSLGEQNGKWTWEGTATGAGGTLQVREYDQRDAKTTKLWGEAMLGGTWQKLYEVTCAR